MTTLLDAYEAASAPNAQARAIIVPYVTAHPLSVKETPPGKDSTILHRLVAAGNVALFRELIRIPGVWFPLDFKDKKGRTFTDVNNESPSGTSKRNMEIYLNFLTEWDGICELAKNKIETENEKVWAWLRRNSQHCYATPPSRKWSIAMQVVFSGHVDFFAFLLSICPQTRGRPPIWEERGNDGMTLMDVAELDEVRFEFPDMYDFVYSKVNGESPPLTAPIPPPPPDELEVVVKMWDSIKPASIRRPVGECPIDRERANLYTCSRDCNHAFSERALAAYFSTTLHNGPFPVRCPLCIAERSDRGLVTRGPIKALVEAEIIPLVEGQRILLQQMRNLPSEADLDLQYSKSKPCPYCATPVAHYKGHGCHHIKPGGGCPSCAKHFCYSCLSSHEDGTTWQGCPNDDPLFCTDECDCPLCPDCTPGHPCGDCDGVNSACPCCRI